MLADFDPDRDLTITRIIRAPRARLWQAWTDPAQLARWFLPEPSILRVDRLEVRPGGALLTAMSENGGSFTPHIDGLFLDVEEGRRLVYTNVVTSSYRPADPGFMTAIISFEDHPDGTDYTAHVMHRSPADRQMHEEAGFEDGWGTVAAQLARLVE
jgi:uncharacterized protein YndB with AHSA1/START domain